MKFNSRLFCSGKKVSKCNTVLRIRKGGFIQNGGRVLYERL